ncbi:sensor histidine kinase [Candidatus Nanogingivalis gingivitcus]|jgi:multi-sensor signal transduction histidine kinase|uniref:histidine kinase n=1 Tax=Candidatus Nanogingivalis gingivitcus TaxID=2171992 RepID=A0ABY0FIW7_9BACT|nr:ATP-binding protein [Candidatus Nanogingivalis gingivitcus]RYC72272.1 Alkaline phosphatase synthesis sensor protein PhoR [Candidatus Nanogingivalis gingivitcus]
MKTNQVGEGNNLRIRFFSVLIIVFAEIVLTITSKDEFRDFLSSLLAVISLDLVFLLFLFDQKKNQNTLIEAQKNIIHEHEKVLAIINSIREAIVSVDIKGNIELYNSAALDFFDTNASLIGKNINNILKLTTLDGKTFNLKKVLVKNKSLFSRNDLSFSLGEEKIRVEIELVAVSDVFLTKERLKDKKYILMIRDITKQKTLDEERDEFISVVSHELRTPVTIAEGAISNLSLAIEKDMPKQVLSKNADITHEQVKFLATMINDLSTLSRAERGVGDKFVELNIKDLGQKILEKYHKNADDKGLNLELVMDNNLPSIKTSELYLEELLQNLITNALKYTKEGEIKISITNNEKNIRFMVEDTGIGISKSDQKKIFDKFYRSEDYRTRETGGTGLGLYVSSKLADKLDTKIELSSKLNHGSKFWFNIKLS